MKEIKHNKYIHQNSISTYYPEMLRISPDNDNQEEKMLDLAFNVLNHGTQKCF